MQTSYIFFFYGFAFTLLLPILILGYIITPTKKIKIKAKTPQPKDVLSLLQKNEKDARKAIEIFEQYYIKAQSCEKNVWLDLLDKIALCKWFETTEVVQIQQRVIQANPSLQKEIETHISNSLKNKK
ncbi:hypothetical protein [uncultured Helicobacter sp.]|uniref:hypothetical protein n=1 Tax=uncultured Helicobacter sp. TaxID=175537 RepID=UPI00263011FD|nr:hypothetical protein [uncultured Helicobacter sp.]